MIAGRDAARASVAAQALGARARGGRLDVADPSTWSLLVDDDGTRQIDVVLVCVDQVDDAFVRFVLEHGIGYVDVSADDAFLQRVEALHEIAVDNDAHAVLAVGFAPGLTNLLAREVVRDVGHGAGGGAGRARRVATRLATGRAPPRRSGGLRRRRHGVMQPCGSPIAVSTVAP